MWFSDISYVSATHGHYRSNFKFQVQTEIGSIIGSLPQTQDLKFYRFGRYWVAVTKWNFKNSPIPPYK